MTGDLVIVGAVDTAGKPAAPLAIGGGAIVNSAVVKGDGVPVLDAAGAMAVPGFVDVQINGGFGHDFTADPTSIWEVASSLPRHGVTAFLPTIISADPGVVITARQVLAAGPPAGRRGAIPLGLHCEGPMIAATRRGTHPEFRLVAPSLDVISAWGGVEGIAMVTIAPELVGAREVIEYLVGRGVVVSLGHSAADARTALDALACGATCGTHLFNAMSGLDHRTPGLAAALLAHRTAAAGMIVDGIHVHPAMAAVAAGVLGPERLVLVTDAMAAVGSGDGVYQLGDVSVTVEGPRATSDGGVLAGSLLTMDQAIRNLIEFTGWSIEAAVATATSTPARVLDDAVRGNLDVGRRGDVVLLDDQLEVVAAVVGGTIVEDRR